MMYIIIFTSGFAAGYIADWLWEMITDESDSNSPR